MRNKELIEVHFLHPRNSTTLTADISPQCTGAEALQELQADDGTGAFIMPSQTGEFYGLALRRGNSSIEITPNMTFAQAGAIDGDVIEIRLGGQGGGPSWTELGHMFFWSAAAASVFLKSAAPILIEFIKSKGGRSIMVESGKLKVTITGANLEKVKEILALLRDSQTSENLSGGADQPEAHQTLPVTITLHDSAKPDSTGG